MARCHSFARFPLVCLLVALGAAGCMQSPQAAVRADAPQGVTAKTAQASCRAAAENTQLRAIERELRTLGLALRVQCAGALPDGALQLVVLDSVRASEVLRGPLADGESVELNPSANASPDVQFNRTWLNHALLRHRVQMAGGEEAQPRLQPVDLAVR